MSKKNKKKTQLPLRLNLLFFAVFLLFSTLILRLGVVQIVKGEDYKRKIDRTDDIVVNTPVPRGKMFDRNYQVVVDNIPKNAITYTQLKGAKPEEMVKVAERLALIIDKDTDKITERDMKDFWMIKNPEAALKKVTKKELESDELEKSDIYRLQLERITEEDLKQLTEKDLKVLAIYREFVSGYALTPQIVKNEDVSSEEYAKVSENLDLLPGVDTTIDWDRDYKFGDTLQTVLGKVTTSNEGLPNEQLDYYLSRGYNRNDRVGKSYLELQYEDILHGQKARIKNITKGNDIIQTEVISEGQRGKDLILTIDMDLQLAVEKIIEEELIAAKRQPRTGLLDRAFVVLLDPHTGEVLSMAGKQYVRNEKTNKMEMRDFALGSITTSYGVGSAVKGATIFTGYKTGVNYPGKVYYDAPLKIKDSPVKRSWTTMGNVNDIKALERSSNVYMFRTAIAIGEGNYQYGHSLPINPKAFDLMRDSFGQFGLGVPTGIDLPNETVGFKGSSTLPGHLLDFAIGQYDTYTAMQLAQYVATVANGGYRVQPHLVKEIREPSLDDEQLGPIVETIGPTVLNRLDIRDDRWLKTIQTGFHRVMQGSQGTARGFFAGKPYNPAGKTGTAEAFYDGPNKSRANAPVMNLSLVGYAPYDNPEVAMAVLVPWAYEGSSGHTANLSIGSRVMDTYFELKQQRNEKQTIENDATSVRVEQVDNSEEVNEQE